MVEKLPGEATIPRGFRSGDTMDQKCIDLLNKALSIEYSAVIQYTQFAALLLREDRRLYREIFEDSAKESQGHALSVADWIVAIGGTPSVETPRFRQARDVTEMLRSALAIEREALETYRKAHAAIGEEGGLKYLIENRIIDEQEDVWELEKLLRQRAPAEAPKETTVSTGA